AASFEDVAVRDRRRRLLRLGVEGGVGQQAVIVDREPSGATLGLSPSFGEVAGVDAGPQPILDHWPSPERVAGPFVFRRGRPGPGLPHTSSCSVNTPARAAASACCRSLPATP